MNYFMSNVVRFHPNEVLDVASVYVFFILFLQLLQYLIKVLNFFMVVFQYFFKHWLAFDSKTQKREYLVDNVWFCIFFRVLENRELLIISFLFRFWKSLFRVLWSTLGLIWHWFKFRSNPLGGVWNILLSWKDVLILVGSW